MSARAVVSGSGSSQASKKCLSQTDKETQQDEECRRSSTGGENTVTHRRRGMTGLGQVAHGVERVTGHTPVPKSGGFSQYSLD